MTRCLVIGGGLIGGHVARRLADAGRAVQLFSRGLNPWLSEERLLGIEVHRGAVETDRESLADLIAGSDCVLHFASSSRPPGAAAAPARDLTQTVLPALVVLEELARCRSGKRLIICSSGGTVYGIPTLLPTPEDHPLAPETPYAISHAAVERYVRFFASSGAFTTNVLRFANIYGPGETGRGGQGVVGTWLRAILGGETPQLLGSPATSRDFLYVGDAAAAVEAVLDNGEPGLTYNVGSGRSHSIAEVAAAIWTSTAARVLPAASTVPHATAAIHETRLDVTRIRNATGWTARVDLVDGIARAWQWMSAEFAREFDDPRASPVGARPQLAATVALERIDGI